MRIAYPRFSPDDKVLGEIPIASPLTGRQMQFDFGDVVNILFRGSTHILRNAKVPRNPSNADKFRPSLVVKKLKLSASEGFAPDFWTRG